MVKRRLKKEVVFILYGILFLLVFSIIFSIEKETSPKLENDDIDFVSKTILENDVPVVSINNVVKRPYNDDSVKIVKDYYDYKDESVEQENSIIYFEDTYLQSSGVNYSNGSTFDVLSILDGVIVSVTSNDLLGNIIEVDHSNGIVAYYQSVDEVAVKVGDIVSCGSKLGVSGESNIAKDLGKHLSFELSINGSLVNPEDYYERNISDIVG